MIKGPRRGPSGGAGPQDKPKRAKTMEDFHRIRRLPPYVFEQVNKAKLAARNAGADIIDLGMGNPDLPAPAHVIEKLKEVVGKPRTDRYSSSRGIPGLRKAQASYYGRRFGVKLNPDTQVVATLGSKEGFANVAQAISAPGDIVLCPNPSYPIHAFGFLMAGGVIRSVPAEANEEYFHALERAVIHSIPKPLAVVVCYPSNPTAHVATLDFYKDLVAFAKKHGIFILSDLAYAEVYFDDKAPPPSVLEVNGAMDVTVEFTSMSKTFSMPGWRMGFAVGNDRIIAALARVKSYLDYGAFTPIQAAAVAALNGPEDCIAEMRSTYKKRRDAMVDTLRPRRLARCRRPPPRCSPGRRCPSRSAKWAASNSPSCWSRRPRSRCRRVSRSASTARATCASRWSRTSSASARPRATSAGSLIRVSTSCTTSSRSRRGASRHQLISFGAQFMATPLKVGLAGLGTVGASVVRLIERQRVALAQRCGRPIEIVAVTARSRAKNRGIDLKKVRWVKDPIALARDPGIDVFVELMGGAGDPAKRAIEAALSSGKSVVTANKALLAKHGVALARLAERNHVALNFEAAVAGGIPIVKTLREGLVGNKLARIYGILNGTCNYILTRMEQEGLSFTDCLKDAQRLGYAEADPTFDIEGHDTAQKLSILASLAFGIKVDERAIYVEGISSITPADLAAADELGYRVKLLGVAVDTGKGIEQRVHPTMVRKDSAIAQVMGVTNAVTVDADAVAAITLVGPGAGGMATASAVVADIGDIARGVRTPPFGRASGSLAPSRKAADAAPRRRLLHPPAGPRQARLRRDHRAPPRPAGHFAGIDCAAPFCPASTGR